MRPVPTAALLLGATVFGSALGVAYVEHLNRELHHALHELALQRDGYLSATTSLTYTDEVRADSAAMRQRFI